MQFAQYFVINSILALCFVSSRDISKRVDFNNEKPLRECKLTDEELEEPTRPPVGFTYNWQGTRRPIRCLFVSLDPLHIPAHDPIMFFIAQIVLSKNNMNGDTARLFCSTLANIVAR